MLTFDTFFNAWMILAAVLVFLKIRKLVKWDWGIVLAPVIVAVLLKVAYAFLNRA
jgi:hypothetical protein